MAPDDENEGEVSEVRGRDRVVRTDNVVSRGEQLTVLDLLAEMKRGWDEKNHDVFAQAILNERYISGRQEFELGPTSQHVLKVTRSEGERRIVRNQLRNLSLTWASRVNDSTSDTRAWSDKPGLAVEVAAVAHAHLQHQKEKQERPRMLARAAMRGLAHGSIYFKVTQDPMKGPMKTPTPILDDDGVPQLDPETGNVVLEGEGEHEGDISVDLFTIHDVLTDGAEDIEHSVWALCRRVMNLYEARALLAEAGFPNEDPEGVTDRKDTWGHELEGVEAYELWMVPCARVPAGLFALVIGGVVVDYQDFPYDHGQLPIACWKIFDRSDSQYGDTHVTETIDLQRALNDLTAALVEMAFQHGANISTVAVQQILDELEEGSKLLPAATAEKPAKDQLAYVGPPAPPEMLVTVIRMLLEAIPEGFGVNEVVASGGAPQQTKSARQLAYIKALDGQKLWLPLQNLVAALVRIDWQQTLLAQQYMTPERMLEVAGDHLANGVQAFFDCDLRTTIKIEATPASENTAAANAANAEESAVAGLIDPATGAELRQTGLDMTGAEAGARRSIQTQIVAALSGEQVAPDPSIDANVAMSELALARELWGKRNPEAAQALQQLELAYAELGAEAQQESQQPLGKPTAAPMAEAQEQQEQGGMP